MFNLYGFNNSRNNNYSSNNFGFELRKDLFQKRQRTFISQLYNTGVNLREVDKNMQAYDQNVSSNINRMNIVMMNELNNKVSKQELDNSVSTILNSNLLSIKEDIQTNVAQLVEPAILTQIQPTLNMAILELNNMKESIMSSINGATEAINTNINQIYSNINKLETDVLNLHESNRDQSYLNNLMSQITQLETDLIELRKGLEDNVDELKIVDTNLLKKIDYLFETFYRSNSEIIIQNYPI